MYSSRDDGMHSWHELIQTEQKIWIGELHFSSSITTSGMLVSNMYMVCEVPFVPLIYQMFE